VIPENNSIHIAYAVAKILVDKGYRAGVLLGANDVAIAIKINDDERLLQIKINQGITEYGTDWIVEQIIKHLSNIN
jgi:hypothetical protein